jgi:xanthine dehydrogenase YagS FAD-binding subunit
MQAFDLIRPADPQAAIAAAAREGAKYIAGGTDLIQLMQDHVETPATLIDLDGLPLRAIEANSDGLRLGALARMADVAAHPSVAADYPAIAQALLSAASPQVRNMGTIGGNLLQRARCNYFRDVGFACNKRTPGAGCPAIAGENRRLAILGGSDSCIATHPSDMPVALAALDAVVVIQGSAGTRRVNLTDFYLLPGDTPWRETVLAPGELVTAVEVPAASWTRHSCYVKLRDRASFEFALVSAAVALEVADGVIRTARIALGGVAPKPWRAEAAEAALHGRPAGAPAFAQAAALATQGAQPASRNGFKVRLAQRAVARALGSLV